MVLGIEMIPDSDYLQKTNDIESVTSNQITENEDEESDILIEEPTGKKKHFFLEIENMTLIFFIVTEVEAEDHLIGDDPGLWPTNISQRDRDYIAKQGPVPVEVQGGNYNFPVNDTGRKFSPNNYYRWLANGEKVLRDWLVYSKAIDSVFCFPCRLFNVKDNKSNLTSTEGYCDWAHLARALIKHEVHQEHIVNYNLWKNLQKSFATNKTIDALELRQFQLEKEYWRNVLRRIISIILFLAGQNLALRGTSENLYVHNNGNFLKTVELLAQFDPLMKEHLNKIQRAPDTRKKVHYLGPRIQNELIEGLAENILRTIVNKIKDARYFSIILDCTPDKQKKEQMTVILRYVDLDKMEVEESFIEFCTIKETTGLNLTDVIVAKIKDLGLDIDNLRGQGYDNGANMRGKNAGVQRRILDLNSRAMFVPCAAHSLNLVVNDSVKSAFQSIDFFSTLHNIYIFFSASTQRWAILKEKVKGLTIKPLSETRWESRIDSVRALRYQIADVYDALVSLSDASTVDNNIRNEANGIALKIKNFKFLVCIVFWYEILNSINATSKLLQNEKLDIIESTKALKAIDDYFVKIRTDEHFSEILVDAAELAAELEIEAVFTNDIRARPRKKTRQFLYESVDEPILDPKEKFKIEFFFVVLDTIHEAFQERFDLLKAHSDYFSFLYDFTILRNINREEITKHCMDLHLYLTDGDKHDINGLELRDEILALIALISPDNAENFSCPKQTLKYLKIHGLIGNFPNIYISIRILLTLPVSVATGERSFSKLKIIENYLRSSMKQERLSGLSLISIEHEIASSLNLDNFISEFAEKKARKKF